MTENLLLKLEEKMMLLLAEVEDLRKEVAYLNKDNAALKAEKESNYKKLSDLLSVLDTVNSTDNMLLNPTMMSAKPVLMQVGQE